MTSPGTEPVIANLSPEQTREAVEAWRQEFRNLLARHPERQSNPGKACDDVIAEINRRTVADGSAVPGHAGAVPGVPGMPVPMLMPGMPGYPGYPGQPAVPGVPVGPNLLDLQRMGEVRGGVNAMVENLITKGFKSELLRVNEKFATIDEYLKHLDITVKLPRGASQRLKITYDKMAAVRKEGTQLLGKSISGAVGSAAIGFGIGLLTGGASWMVIGASIAGSTLARAGVSAFRIIDRLWRGGTEYKLRNEAAAAEVERGQQAIEQAHKVRDAMRTYDAAPTVEHYQQYLAEATTLTTLVQQNDRVESGDQYHTAESEALAKHQQAVNTVESWLAVAGGLAGGIYEARQIAQATLTGGSVEGYAQAKLEAAKQHGTHLRGHFITWAQNNWHAILQSGPHSEVAKGAAEAAKYGYDFTEIFKAGGEQAITATTAHPIHKFALEGASEQLLKQYGAEGAQKFGAAWTRLGAQAVGAALAGGGMGWLTGRRMIETEHRVGADDRLARAATRPTAPSLAEKLQAESRRWGVQPTTPTEPSPTSPAPTAPDGRGPQSVEVQTGRTFEVGDTFDRTALGLAGDDFAVYRVAGKLPDGRIQLDIFKTVGGIVKEPPKAVTPAELEALVKDAVKQQQTVEQIAFLKPFEQTLTHPIEAALAASKVVQIQFKDAVTDPSSLNSIDPRLVKDVKYFVKALHLKQYIPTIELRYDDPGTGEEKYQEVPMHHLFPYLKPKLEITDGAPPSPAAPAAPATPVGTPAAPGSTPPGPTAPVKEPTEKEKAEEILATRRAAGGVELLVPTEFTEKRIITLKTNPAAATAVGDNVRYVITKVGDKFIELKQLQWDSTKAAYEREVLAPAGKPKPGAPPPTPTLGKFLTDDTVPMISYTASELANYVEKGWGTAIF